MIQERHIKKNHSPQKDDSSVQETGIETREDREEGEAKKFYENLIPLGEIMFGKWGYTVEVDPTLPTFAFDHKTRKIMVSPSLDRTITSELQKTFVFCHEIGHLVQLFQNPEQYVKTFEDAKEKGKKVASESGDEELGVVVEQAWNHFFNAFLDIHDNSIVKERIPTFQTERGREETKVLYEKLVKDDLTTETLSQQFLFALLRSVMIPGSSSALSPEVESIIQSPVSYLGKQYDSLEEACRELLWVGSLDLGTALFRIKKLFSPYFEALLAKDIVQQPDALKKGRKPSLSPGEVTSAPGEVGHSPSAQEIADIINEHKKAQESMANKTESVIDSIVEVQGKEAGISSKQIDRMKEIVRSVGETYRSLIDIWERFFSISHDLEMVDQEGYVSGQSISVSRLIRDLPSLFSAPGDARVFNRKVLAESKESIRPKKISLYLLLDMSGSMRIRDRERVQEAAYAITKSLVQFKRKMALEDKTLASQLSVYVRMIGFGDSMEDLLTPTALERDNRSLDENTFDPRLWKALAAIEKDLGGTQDAQPLSSILGDIKKGQELLDDDKETAVVFEITDGETTTAGESIRILDEMSNIKNVHCRGIQIGSGERMSEEERDPAEGGGRRIPRTFAPTGTFRRVWKDKGRNLPDISNLKEVLIDLLVEVLRKD